MSTCKLTVSPEALQLVQKEYNATCERLRGLSLSVWGMAARTENLLTTGPDHCYSLPVSDMLDVVGQMRRLDGKRTALFEMLQDFEKAQETPT